MSFRRYVCKSISGEAQEHFSRPRWSAVIFPMIEVRTPPLEVVPTRSGTGSVLRYVTSQEYTRSFGFQWTSYPLVLADDVIGLPVGRARLELNLGFPLEFLKGMNVLELGCGPGRFTEHLADYAKAVVAVDLSDGIYHNSAAGRANVLLLQADLLRLPEFTETFQLVFCRGVIQHTPSPEVTIKRLFDYVENEGLVVFDVYRRYPTDWRSFKYFWRPILQQFISIERFNAFLESYGSKVYRWHHAWQRFCRSFPLVGPLLRGTPLFLAVNWEKEYQFLTPTQRVERFKLELIDMLYSEFDQPMYTNQVIRYLGKLGQRPYSVDVARNHFRCKKNATGRPFKAVLTKNGVQEVVKASKQVNPSP